MMVNMMRSMKIFKDEKRKLVMVLEHVRIIKCCGKNYWYKDKIGYVYDVYDQSEEDYLVCGTWNLIMKCDCEIVHDDKYEYNEEYEEFG